MARRGGAVNLTRTCKVCGDDFDLRGPDDIRECCSRYCIAQAKGHGTGGKLNEGAVRTARARAAGERLRPTSRTRRHV